MHITMRRLRIHSGSVETIAELDDSLTADAIWEALPFSARSNTWGDEVYFSIPVELEEENAQAVVAVGDLGYWPPGRAFCIFFGPTPASKAEEIRPASPVNVFGRVVGDARVLKQVRNGDEVMVKRAP